MNVDDIELAGLHQGLQHEHFGPAVPNLPVCCEPKWIESLSHHNQAFRAEQSIHVFPDDAADRGGIPDMEDFHFLCRAAPKVEKA